MISLDLARRLRDAGLRWQPQSGDRFVVTQPGLEADVFTVSEMTIEAHHYPTGTILGFNGTTEWALDSVAIDGALWLPREDQLRELLGGTFRGLVREPDGYRVTTGRVDGSEPAFTAVHAADAYALALLDLMASALAGLTRHLLV